MTDDTGIKTHDPLCPMAWGCSSPQGAAHKGDNFGLPCPHCERECSCKLIANVRDDERARKGTCWREVEGAQIPSGAIRVYREAGWFWEMP